MPKLRKNRKQKKQAITRSNSVKPTASPTISHEMQHIKIPEKFSLKNTSGKYINTPATTHEYLKPELLKTALLSGSIIIFQIVLFFFLRNHIIVLSNLPY